MNKSNWFGIACFVCVIMLLLITTIALDGAKSESRRLQAEVNQLKADLAETQDLIDAYRQHNQAVSSFLGQAAETLEGIAYGPYTREEVQGLITRVVDILQRANEIIAPEETHITSKAIVQCSIVADKDPQMVTAVAWTESNCQPLARGDAGEYGMMQILPETGRWIAGQLGYGPDWKPEDMLDIRQNIQFAVYYLRVVTKEFGGDVNKGLLAYNRGSSGARAWLEEHDADQHDYVRKVQLNYLKAGVVRP